MAFSCCSRFFRSARQFGERQLPDVFISFAWLYLSDFPYFIIAVFAFYNVSLATLHSPPSPFNPATLSSLHSPLSCVVSRATYSLRVFRFRLTLSPAASTQCFVPSMSASWSDPLHIQHTWTYVRVAIHMNVCICMYVHVCVRVCLLWIRFLCIVVQVRTCCQMNSNTLIRFMVYPVIVWSGQNEGDNWVSYSSKSCRYLQL